MAYSLKSVHYKNQQRKILLQNENGPCPLLAAANALLLSAQITLPPSSVRNNVASIDDVVNMLAGHALKRHMDHNNNTNNGTETNNDGGGNPDVNAAATAHHIDELLKLFPSLQHGMDVNPKFTLGPTGCEYTNGLGAFDIMGVDLVHGWLIDVEQDSDTASIIGSKSYNELVEIVITGNEAMEKADVLRKKMNKVLSTNEPDVDGALNTHQDEAKEEKMVDQNNDTVASSTIEGEEVGDSSKDLKSMKENENDKDTEDIKEGNPSNEEEKEKDDDGSIEQNQQDSRMNIIDTKELENMQHELQELDKAANTGLIVKQFLDTTCHQLTYTGLMELHTYVKEGHLCVFFRNNHFATLTKNEGILYLLVTDLGYAGVQEVTWEKLDDITGDTELYDGKFCKSQINSINPASAGPNLNPEQLLAQRGQSDADYQLALELSRTGQVNSGTLADREGDLIAAATELSLQEYNNQGHGTVANLNPTSNANVVGGQVNSQESTGVDQETSDALAYDLQMRMNEERDRAVAMRLQAQLNAADTVNNTTNNTDPRSTFEVSQETRRRRGGDRDSGCFIC